ncbi:MAG: hypothetical protein EP330_27775 [Deltaproteobacteria bacterium]|nr:MAG: hypothetical protein EP330_27775 [Deltaproteobacteria bacterium]
MTRFSSLLLLLAAGCTPNNAVLESGSYLAFFPTDGSPVLREGKIKIDEEGEVGLLNCSGELAELGGVNQANCDALGLDGTFQKPDEPWTDDDSFTALFDDLEPWRGEGLLTNEGDLQVTFHHNLSGGADFRFVFVIDPDFQPQRCVQGEGGGSQWENIDGNWLENWSTGADGATRYYLNAGAVQVNPDPSSWSPDSYDEDEWFLPDEWFAGTAAGQYGPSRLGIRRALYEWPWASAARYQGWENIPGGAGNKYIQDVNNIVTLDVDCADAQAVADGIETNLQGMTANMSGPANMTLGPVVECNEWRERDSSPAGLDGWRGIHYNWVDIDNPDVEVGDSVSGTFHLALQGDSSQTFIYIQGDFTVDKIKREKWGNPDLNTELIEENNVELCGGSASSARIREERAWRALDLEVDAERGL